jgi:photoactive yellow protein
MPDTPDPASSDDSSSPEQETYTQQWEALCEELGTSDPNEVLARVQTLKRQMEQTGAPDEEDGEGLVTISEVEEVFREMNERIEKLRERNAALAEQAEDDGDVGPQRQTEQLLEALDVPSVDAAEERIERLNQRLEDFYQEKERLAEAGLSGASDALDEIERLRSERDALRQERDQLQAERDRSVATGDEDAAAPAEPDGPAADDMLPAEIGDILDIRTVEEAQELAALTDDMSSQLERLRREHEKLDAAGLSVEEALTMIENMKGQLADLYHHADRAETPATDRLGPQGDGGREVLDDTLRRRIEALTDASLGAADDLTDVVPPLIDRLEALSEEHRPLAEAGLEGEEAVALIENMKAQLDDLYRRVEDRPDAADRLDAIEEVLGISTRQEAEQLAELAEQMETQLTVLYEEKEKLQDLGLSSIEDAVSMIESMESQLDDLYEDKKSLGDTQLDDTEKQSTFQQLEALYAERQRLQQALGVSSAEDVIEMVETLTSQVEDLYTGRDAEVDPQERHEARLWSPDGADTPAPDASSSTEPSSEDTSLTVRSLERQLEALYREKETLLRQGLRSAQEAVDRLQAQQQQIDGLRHENQTHEHRFDRLRSAFGTEQVSRIVELVQALEAEAGTSLAEVRPGPTDAADASMDYGVHIEATAPLVDADTLDRLDEMSDDALEALDVGAVQLRDDGTVAALNDAAFRLPDLPDQADRAAVLGEHFFRDLAPSTDNGLFFGRFREGRRRGELDARFPYTFAGPSGAAAFTVHLYRSPGRETTWLLFRPA